MKKRMDLFRLRVKSFVTHMPNCERIKGGNTLAIGCRTNNHLCKPEDTETGDCPLPN
ncbi:MAG: hypothetical protein WBB45_02800 [Cyclobacteriaceae bacterium]